MVRYDFGRISCQIAETSESFEADCTATYRIQRINCLDVSRGIQLQSAGYTFHDRVFNVEVVGSESEVITFPQEVTYEISEVCANELYQLATESFQHDRRFHLEREFNQNLANEVIEAYLTSFEKEHCSVVKIKHKDILLGFVVLRDIDGKKFENVLACTKPGIKGKMIAYPMYQTAIAFGKKLTCSEGVYIGRVSSANMASLNLHRSLGAKIIAIEDEYIFSQRKYEK